MAESQSACLRCRRLLVVEDEYVIALDLAHTLEDAGAEVVGPLSTVEDALDYVANEGDRLDAAVLDVNLRNERVYPVADALAARGIPFVLTTGYDRSTIPATYAAAPHCQKPIDKAWLMRLLSAHCAKRDSGAAQDRRAPKAPDDESNEPSNPTGPS